MDILPFSRSMDILSFFRVQRNYDSANSSQNEMAKSSPEPPLAATRRSILSVPPTAQAHSPLYAVPPEIRELIFSFALTDYPDPNPQKQYGAETNFTRPEYSAPRRTDTALLRTCRAIYSECWFMPFVLKEHTHWLTAPDRAPPEYAKILRAGGAATYYADWFREFRRLQGEQDWPEIRHLRVFAQMWSLERDHLATLLDRPELRPRRLILTIRHADWWFWEEDEPLHIDGKWIKRLSETLPSSVREFCLELETIQRKTEQLDDVAKQMREKWFVMRKDGVALFPDATGKNVEVSRWAGKSIWDGRRWLREESSPGRIDYYVLRIPFQPQNVVSRAGGQVSEQARIAADSGIYDEEVLNLHVSRDKIRDYRMGRGHMWVDDDGDEIEWEEEEEEEDEDEEEEEDEDEEDEEDEEEEEEDDGEGEGGA